MEAWRGLHVPEQVLSRLEELGFTDPTTIQRLVLPAAIRDRKDILGAAETGSGKTLAFAIPVIHRILEIKAFEKEKQEKSKGDFDKPDEAESSDNTDMSSDEADGDFDRPPDEEDLLYTWEEDEIVPDISILVEEIQVPENKSKTSILKRKDDKVTVKPSESETPLYAIVLTPTRELAIQVSKHIEAVASYTDIKVGTVIGGMSAQKQARILAKRPEILVSTPGRFWDFVQSGHPHLRNAAAVPLLVLDEADRLLESGHFAEVRSFLDRVRVTPVTLGPKKQRQTFIFSATLTFIHAAPKRKLKKKMKGNRQLNAQDRVGFFMEALGLTERKPRVVDCTQKVATLTEACLQNSGHPTERDLHLFWLLRSFPGRTLVFCNSKNSSRRLVSVLRLLRCRNPLPLHADMHQKARLKNLERFVEDADGLLVASDVAARGLDIPRVEHVIHYQAPKTSETYVHRSGRTARANRDGQSVVLLGPDDFPAFRKLMWNMNRRVEDLTPLTPSADELAPLRRIVDVAHDLEALEHRRVRSRGREDWFERTAREADLMWGDDSSDSGEDEAAARASDRAARREEAAAAGMRRGLNQLLDALSQREAEGVEVAEARLVPARFPAQATTFRQLAAEEQQRRAGKRPAAEAPVQGKKGRRKRRRRAAAVSPDRRADSAQSHG